MAQVLSKRRYRYIPDVIDLLPARALKSTDRQMGKADIRRHESRPTGPDSRLDIDQERRETRHESPVEARVILVVDDEPSFLRLMQIFLTTHQYVPLPCPSARNASAKARQHQPQLIMLDLHMPLIDDGRWVLKELRRDPRTRSIPVVVTSADPRGLEKHAAELKSGSVAQLVKPFDLEQLLTVIRLALDHPSDEANASAQLGKTKTDSHEDGE